MSNETKIAAGFVLVPVEPTKEMVEAGRNLSGAPAYLSVEVKNIWADMIEAAPAATHAAAEEPAPDPHAVRLARALDGLMEGSRFYAIGDDKPYWHTKAMPTTKALDEARMALEDYRAPTSASVAPATASVAPKCHNPGRCLAGIDGAECSAFTCGAPSAAAVQAEPADHRLDKPARVGGTIFGVGVQARLVIEAAQRAVDHPQGLVDAEIAAEFRQLIADNAGRAAFLDAHPAVTKELSDLIEENERLTDALAATQPQATEREALSEERAVTANSVMCTAPARIWLNLFDTTVDTDGERLFPEDHEGVTWAEDEVGDYDVQYIRADLAGINTKG